MRVSKNLTDCVFGTQKENAVILREGDALAHLQFRATLTESNHNAVFKVGSKIFHLPAFVASNGDYLVEWPEWVSPKRHEFCKAYTVPGFAGWEKKPEPVDVNYNPEIGEMLEAAKLAAQSGL